MAHKTLVGGTAYEIGGGKTLVDGTAYSIKNGKTLVGGTAYDVSFDDGMRTITFTQAFDGSAYITINGTKYVCMGGTREIVVPLGTEIALTLIAMSNCSAIIEVNGTVVAQSIKPSTQTTVEYTYVVQRDVLIKNEIAMLNYRKFIVTD